MLFGPTGGATLSTCARYRYRLWREWDAKLGKVAFHMLNPSDADAETDDPTIRKCVGFASRWGYGGIVVVNLFGFRSPYPNALTFEAHPVSEPGDPHRNFREVRAALDEAEMIVPAWGNWGSKLNVGPDMLRTLEGMPQWQPKLHVLGFNKDCSPMHPLMVSYAVQPVPLVA